MSYAPMKVSGKGVHKVECPVCGFVWRNYDILMRWDGRRVCPKCWEPRHPLDFYRTIPDTFKLPFSWPQGTELTWTPSFSALTQTANHGAVTVTAAYVQVNNPTPTNTLNFVVNIYVTVDATTASTASTMTLPVACVTAGTFRVLDVDSVILGTGTIAALATTITLPTWVARNRSIVISGTYGY